MPISRVHPRVPFKAAPNSGQRPRISTPSAAIGRVEIGVFDEDNVVANAKAVRLKYKNIQNGHHQRVYNILQDFYYVYLTLREDENAWNELKRDPYWETCQRKPEKLTMRDIVLFLSGAEAPNDRSRAAKYAVLLGHYEKQGVKANQIATTIAKDGGVDKALASVNAAKRESAGGTQTDTTDGKLNNKQLMSKYVDLDTSVVLKASPEFMSQLIDENRKSTRIFIVTIVASPPGEDGWAHLTLRNINRSFNRPLAASDSEAENDDDDV